MFHIAKHVFGIQFANACSTCYSMYDSSNCGVQCRQRELPGRVCVRCHLGSYFGYPARRCAYSTPVCGFGKCFDIHTFYPRVSALSVFLLIMKLEQQQSSPLLPSPLTPLLNSSSCREEQGHESELFVSHFRNVGGLQIRSGGYDAALRKASEGNKHENVLFHVKGRRNVAVHEVPLSVKSLNAGDAFILDAGDNIYLWNGASANKLEKTKAVEVSNRIHASRSSRGQRVLVAEGEADPEQIAAFWELLGGTEAEVGPAVEDGADTPEVKKPTLLHVSDASGTLEFNEVDLGETGRLTQSQLVSADVFLVDIGSKVFVWIGKGCSKDGT
jgi:gelsolin